MRYVLIFLMLVPGPTWARTFDEALEQNDELIFVLELFADLQLKSFAQNVEYCGYLGRDHTGQLVRTVHSKGDEAGCWLPRWPRWDVIASYHTHSTYSVNYDSELPSALDFESDQSSGIDGYIATPGGRLWYLDSDSMVARQICSLGCLPQDPNFKPLPVGDVKESYSYEAIVKRQGG